MLVENIPNQTTSHRDVSLYRTPLAASSALTVDTILSADAQQGVLGIPIRNLCAAVQASPDLLNAHIISASVYFRRYHSIVLHLRRANRDDIWLRLERKPKTLLRSMKQIAFRKDPPKDMVSHLTPYRIPASFPDSAKGISRGESPTRCWRSQAQDSA
jgi:hypothetical protein